jgi:hypothetical protein
MVTKISILVTKAVLKMKSMIREENKENTP